MVASFAKASALAMVVLAASTKAHQQMTVPVATWPPNFHSKNSPSGTIDAAKALPVPSGMSYNTDGISNVNAYWTAVNASKYKSLKEFCWATQTLAPGASKECGYSLVDGTPQELPDMVEWDAFSHVGPCEVWCDEVRVFQNWNCAADYKMVPAKLPYDKAKCKGASVLSSHWIAVHTTPWQVYSNCAPIEGGSPGGSNPKPETPETDTPATPPTDTPYAATPETDTPATPSTDTPYAAPPTDTSTPPATPTQTEANDQTDTKVDNADKTTPSTPSTDKCAVRRRRH